MNMFAKFDEIPAMTLQDIRKQNVINTAVSLSKNIFSEPNSFMHIFNVSMKKCQIVPSKAVVGVDRPVYGL